MYSILTMRWRARVCEVAYVCACACERARARMHACVCVCVRERERERLGEYVDLRSLYIKMDTIPNSCGVILTSACRLPV